jgi:hypothetical protein
MKKLPLRVVLVVLALMGGVVVLAQNPISITRLGTSATGVTVTTVLPISAASLPLPSGAATSALQSTINTTLGSPFQAGGSIGNTSFAATQSGTWTVQPGNTANTTAWKVTNADSGGTSMTDTTAHALKTFAVDPATGTALVVPSSGNGTSDSGTLRVAVASNNTAIAGAGVGATGSAPPVNAVLNGGLQSGATGGLLGAIAVCDSSKGVNVTTATTTLMVTGVSGRQVRVCALKLVTAAANNVQFISGTGATCGTGTTGIGGGGTTAASGDNYAANGGSAYGSGLGQLFTTTATGDSLCLVTSANTQLSGIITYTIY